MKTVYALSAITTLITLLVPLSEEDYRVAANWSLTTLALYSVVFTCRYIIWADWRSNPVGRVFAGASVLLAIVLSYAALSAWIPEHPYKQYLRFILYTAGAAGMLNMLVSLWRQQRKDRKSKCRSSSSGPTDQM